MSPRPAAATRYFVVMLDLGSFGFEAIVDPTLTRTDILGRIVDGNYPHDRIVSIHAIKTDGTWDDVSDALINAALDVREAA